MVKTSIHQLVPTPKEACTDKPQTYTEARHTGPHFLSSHNSREMYRCVVRAQGSRELTANGQEASFRNDGNVLSRAVVTEQLHEINKKKSLTCILSSVGRGDKAEQQKFFESGHGMWSGSSPTPKTKVQDPHVCERPNRTDNKNYDCRGREAKRTITEH